MRGGNSAAKTRPRLRYWRGHGIHSPFVYSLVREVFMRSGMADDDTDLYDTLISAGVGKRTAAQLHNLYHFCSFSYFSVNDPTPEAGNHLRIHTLSSVPEGIPFVATDNNDSALCIICGHNRRKKQICRKMVDNHSGISIDRKGYYLYFYSSSQTKHHYKL